MKLISILMLLFMSTAVLAQRKSNGDSASINYLLPDSVKATQLYSSISAKGSGNAFYGLVFNRGKTGLQLRSKQKSIVFSINGNGSSLAKGIDVDSIKPGIYQWKYNWQEGRNYKFLVTTISDSVSRSLIYTGYVFLPEKAQWKLLASFKSTDGAGFILAPEVQMIRGKQKKQEAALSVEQVWIQRRSGSWKQLTDQSFGNPQGRFALSSDTGNLVIKATQAANKDLPKASLNKDLPQATAASPNNDVPQGKTYKAPVVNVTNHIDSLAQTRIDKLEIKAAVATGKIDTTGAIDDVYFHILKEGSGAFVKVSDTLNVYYKGWLLKNDQVFDQTKDQPAGFPLSRLIKGWQIGLTKCRVGGKIRLFIPSGLAYSIRSRSKDIPPNSVLVFDVEVLDAKPAL